MFSVTLVSFEHFLFSVLLYNLQDIEKEEINTAFVSVLGSLDKEIFALHIEYMYLDRDVERS